jgi:hypothetical protein
MPEPTYKSYYWSHPYHLDGYYNRYSDFGAPTKLIYRDRGTSLAFTNISAGVKLPRWRDLIKQGLGATTPFGYSYQDARQVPLQIWQYLSWKDVFGSTFRHEQRLEGLAPLTGVVSLPTATVASQANAKDRCLRRFHDKWESVQSSFEAGQDLGESREALRMITRPADALRSNTLAYLDDLAKIGARKYRSIAHLVKAVTGSYLEWTYGWKPATSSIASAIVGFQNQSRHFDAVPVYSSATDTSSGSSQEVVLLSKPPLTLYGTRKSFASYTYRAFGMVRTGAVDGRIGTAQMLQLDLPHFVPTLYDLIPYSFVVDYFTNLGDIVHSLAHRRADLIWSCFSSRHTRQCVISPTRMIRNEPTPPGTLFYDRYGYRGGNAVVSQVDGTREDFVPGYLGAVGFQFRIPISSKPWENLSVLMADKLATAVTSLTRRR